MKYCLGSFFTPEGTNYRVGLCIPDSCDPRFETKLFRNYLKPKYNLSTIYCDAPKPDQSSLLHYGTSTFLLIYGALLIFATCFGRQTALTAALSLKKNFKQLCEIRGNSHNPLECLNGIRVISMVWIVIHHCFTCHFNTPGRHNYDEYLEWKSGPGGKVVTVARLAVDSFFVVAALLLTIGFLKARDKG